MALSVPQPTVTQDGTSANVLSATKAITITCSPVAFADGSPLAAPHASQATYVLYRQPNLGALQAWDPASKTWRSAVPLPAGEKMFYKDAAWTGLLVAVGQNDAGGNPLFDPAVTATYTVGCQFAGTDPAGGAETGASSPSAAFTVQPPGADHRGGLLIDPQDPAKTTTVQMFLKDSSFATRATVTLSSVTGGYGIVISAGGASVEVVDDGTITLTPGPSTAVRVAGDLNVDGRLFADGVQLA